jgi:hypothetical protein
MSNPLIEMAAMIRERDEALLSLNREKIMAFARRWSPEFLRVAGLSDEIFWLSVHTARTANRNLPDAERVKSRQYLIERGSQSLDDGDLP